MNEVYISGKVDSISTLRIAESKNVHLMLQVRVSHQKRNKKVKHELYTVNAWNNLAAWANRVIKPDMPVMVRGYLTQRSQNGNIQVEVTAKHFWLGQAKPSITDLPDP